MSSQLNFDTPFTSTFSAKRARKMEMLKGHSSLRHFVSEGSSFLSSINTGTVAVMIAIAALILAISGLVIDVPKNRVSEPSQDHHPDSHANDHPHPDNRSLADTSTVSLNLYHPADSMTGTVSVVSTEHIGKVGTPSTIVLDIYVHQYRTDDPNDFSHVGAFGSNAGGGGMMHAYAGNSTGPYLCKLPMLNGASIIGGFFKLTLYGDQHIERNQAIVLSTDDKIAVGTNGTAPLETMASLDLSNVNAQNPDNPESTSAITSSYSLTTQKYLYIHDTSDVAPGGQTIDYHIQLKIAFTLI